MPEYSETHLRQLEILPEEMLNQSVAIIGLGGIGSPTAYMLAKMGMKNLTIYDFDEVDTHNISTQFYGLLDVGKFKTISLENRIRDELGMTVKAFPAKVQKIPSTDIVITAIDSMDERIKIFNATEEFPKWIIDARMGLEFCRIYAFSPFDMYAVEQYKKSLYPSSEAEELPCSARAVVYNTFFIGSIITSIVKKILVGEEVPFETMADIGKFAIKTFPAKRR